MCFLVVLFMIFCVISCSKNDKNQKFEVAFEWNYVNFTWPSLESLNKLKYSPYDYVPVGIQFYPPIKELFIALPRNKENARIVLASIPLDASKSNPLLTPYPNWEMNSVDDCTALQDLISMQIDDDGIMWVLDAKRTNKNVTCPPKIVLLDLNNGGEVIQSYNVPKEQCSEGCYLNDLVIDGDFMYSSDFTMHDPGIFIYNRHLNKSWKARNNATMIGDIKASNFVAQGVKFTGPSHINGIALSSNCSENRTFYYTPQTSFKIYSIPTWVLRDEKLATGDISTFIDVVVQKPSATAGMICDWSDNLYYGLLLLDEVVVKSANDSNATTIERNSNHLKWPDSFAFDGFGNLFLSATNILKFNTEELNTSDRLYEV